MDNPRIIHAPMNGRRYGVTAPITQYDYGYLLLPEGEELPTTYEVDFSNDEHKGTSLTVYGDSEGAEVPEELIRTGKDVFAFYYKVGEGYGKTDFTWRIPNHCRPSRDGETPTPSQQSSIDQLIVRSNEAVEQAEQSASDASTSAQNASADAERAEEARADAQNYATQAEQARDDAQTYANNASASATASANSASQSAQIKTDVEDLVDDAQASASASAQSATASANSASQASASATSASQSASSASGYATSAQSSAQTASTKASEASTSAQTASAKASEASGYATTASNKATEASGYATSASQAKTDAESARDLAQGYASDAQGYANDAQASAESISASASQIAQNTADIASLEDDRYKPYATDSASGSIASFPDGADGIPLKSLIVDINPIQDLSHGDPSPENLCPISGWTGMQLNANGTVIPISWQTEAGTVYGGKLDVLSGVLTVEKRSIVVDSTKIVRDSGTRYHVAKSNIGDFKSTAFAIMNKFRPRIAPEGWNTGGTFFLDSNNLQMNAYRAFDTRAEFIEEYGELQLCFALATPITIQLTPHEVNSLLGQNNIFADTGDTACEYRADTKLYIERLTAPDSADMIADANITSGQYFMVGNNLYLATANIASGSAVIVGTNATRKSLSEALNEINA